jgi:hypothetical protein
MGQPGDNRHCTRFPPISKKHELGIAGAREDSRKILVSLFVILALLTGSLFAISTFDSRSQDENPFGSMPENEPMHFSDASGGYGLVAPVTSMEPVIDGLRSPGEWNDSRFDNVNITGTGYMTVHAKVVNDFLFMAVVLDPAFDNKVENNDRCTLLFDVDHDGGTAPQSDDLMVYLERQPPVLRALSTGNGTSWISQTWPNEWLAAVADAGSTEEVYEFKINASAVFDGQDGDLIGLGVYLYENNLPSFRKVYWPDQIDPVDKPENVPDSWGHLILNRSNLVVDEVSSTGIDLEYVELYNNRSSSIQIDHLAIMDQDGNVSTLPNMSIPAHARLVVRSGNGIDDLDFSDNYGTVFTGGSDWWNDSGDDVLLRFNGNNCTLDYMQYGSGIHIDSHPAETASPSNWTQDSPPLQAPTLTQYLRRLPSGRDLNLSSDWILYDTLLNPLHHIALSPMYVFPSVYSVNAGGTIDNYIAIGWNDALESELNRSWIPSWGSSSGLGSAIGSGGDWISGYTADYNAGTALGYDNITVIDTASTVSNSSSIRIMPDVPWRVMMISGSGQVSSAGTTLQNPFVIEIRDRFNNRLEGENVWFNVTTTGLNSDGSLSTTNPVLTDASGRASTVLTLDTMAGANTVKAECSCLSISSVTFSAVGNLPVISTGLEANVTKALAGRTLAFFMYFANEGTEPALDVYLNITMPPSLDYVSDSSGIVPTVQGSTYSWFMPVLQIGQEAFVLICRVDPGVLNGTIISVFFTVDFSNQAGSKMPIETSNIVVIVATDKPILNVPPDIEKVPNLAVRHDFDYRFDLSPYIEDEDTANDGLYLILSDNANVRIDPMDNLTIILNYSIAYLGSDISLNITVSDGTGSDWIVIKVNVTSNYPPELANSIPNVTLKEDTDAYPFRISDYFFDRDGTSLVFSHSESLLNIEILVNDTVYIEPPSDWFGIRNVTFRATDSSGAMVEDIVMITVDPVNDPPVLLPFPDQHVKEGATWTLDLSPYIQDVDNPLSDIRIASNSPHVTTEGLNVTFHYPSAIDLDTITIYVTDGTDQVEGEIKVSVAPLSLLENPLFWLMIIVIISIVLSVILATSLRKELVVDDAFLIYMNGALLAHAARKITANIDSEIFSSMLTAIQDFVRDSFDRESDGGLKKIEFRDKTIAIERSDSGLFSIALIYRGSGSEEKLFKKARNLMKFTEKEYEYVLKNWDGDTKKLKGLNTQLRQTFKIRT